VIQVIDRACAILELVAGNPTAGVTGSELAAALQINPPTCANILRSLAARGMVEQKRPRGPWFLGRALHRLARPRQIGIDAILKVCDPVLREVVGRISASVEIVELHGAVRIHHRRLNPDEELQVAPLFDHKPLLLTGSGRLLLAYQDDEDAAVQLAQQQHMKLNGASGQESAKALRSAFAAIRRKGHVVLHDETGSAEISAGAVPVRRFERVILALGWYMPRTRCTGRQVRIINSELGSAVERLEHEGRKREEQR
jgi:DNA-binding IclR family transcriptional regulator